MCQDAITQKLDFAKQLSVVLQGEVKPSESLRTRNKHKSVYWLSMTAKAAV